MKKLKEGSHILETFSEKSTENLGDAISKYLETSDPLKKHQYYSRITTIIEKEKEKNHVEEPHKVEA